VNRRTIWRGWSRVGSAPLLERYVVGEIARQGSWGERPVTLGHHRDRDQREVDLVLERGRDLVAVEVKATATPSLSHAKHLAFLRAPAIASAVAWCCTRVLDGCGSGIGCSQYRCRRCGPEMVTARHVGARVQARVAGGRSGPRGAKGGPGGPRRCRVSTSSPDDARARTGRPPARVDSTCRRAGRHRAVPLPPRSGPSVDRAPLVRRR